LHSSYNRRTATNVKGGRVQRKNRHIPTGSIQLMIDRESPGRGFRHVLTKRDLLAFIDIIPDWPRLSDRLERVLLSSCGGDWYGLHEFYHREETGGIFLHAWDEELWMDVASKFYCDHEEILIKLGVSCTVIRRDGAIVGDVTCRFTEAQARAFMLLHVFLHELGHHYYQVHQKHRGPGSGEAYAENFANRRFNQIYPDYVRVFGDPAKS
jgi:hypothetical protein